MKKIDQKDAIKKLKDHQANGFHVDSRLLEEVKKDGDYFLIHLINKESFFSLIWQEIDYSRLLTPPGKPRCLFDVGNRFIKCDYSFEQLSEPMQLSANQHNHQWFKNCISINSDFDYKKFGLITIVPAKDCERTQSPKGTFYIYDGIHKSLVLAVKILRKEIDYQEIEALLMIPRRK